MAIYTITPEQLTTWVRDNPRTRACSMVTSHTGINVERISFDEALTRADSGDEDLVPEAERMMERFSLPIETAGREWAPSPAGGYPVVPEFLMGRPDPMRAPVMAVNDTMPVRIVVDLFASCGFSGKQLRERGIVILSLVLMLQRFRPVELELLTSSRDQSYQPCGLLIPVYSKPLNISRAAFFFRPVFFRFLTASYLDKKLHVPSSIPCDTGHQCAKELQLGPQDLYIAPAIGYSDETDRILGNPVQWLQEQLDRFMGERS